VSLLDELGACTDRHFSISCSGRCCCTEVAHFSHLSAMRVFLVLRVLEKCSCVGLFWWGEFREERPPRGFLGSLSCSLPLQLSFRMSAALIWRWMRFLSFYQGAIAAARRRFCICLLRTFPIQVAITTQRTSRELLVVGSDITKVLAVVALRKASLSSV
jgi:hypothetical protein